MPARTSTIVTLLKWILPVVIVLLIGATFIATFFTEEEEGVRISFMEENATEEDFTTRMVSPNFRGRTDRDLPFAIEADEAVQLDADHVELSTIRGRITMKDGDNFHLTSNNGTINVKTNTVVLSEQIHIVSDTGYEIKTSQAEANFKKEEAHGHAKVQGEGMIGSIEADEFYVSLPKDVLRFKDNVRVILSRDDTL